MSDTLPHYFLLSEARAHGVGMGEPFDMHSTGSGQWRFVLESGADQAVLDISDHEPESDRQRLELLAVIRGLEALDQPSRVTLVTGSRYVHHGLRYGIAEWRENGWQWERFGEMTPIRNADLWKRLDRTLRYHRVECRTLRFDRALDGGATANDQLSAPARPHFSLGPRREPHRANH